MRARVAVTHIAAGRVVAQRAKRLHRVAFSVAAALRAWLLLTSVVGVVFVRAVERRAVK